MKKKLLSAVLALNLLILSGCGGTNSDAPSSKWVDSDIEGSITADTVVSVKDDFIAAVNKDLYASGELKGSVIANTARKVTEKKRALVEDSSVTGKNIEEVRKYVELIEDTETRNKLGVSPLEPYIQSIENIASVNELYEWLPDPEKNPLCAGIVDFSGESRSELDPTSYYVTVSKNKFSLGNADNYYKVSDANLQNIVVVEDTVEYILGRIGYDEKSIRDILDSNFQIEKKISRFTKDLKEDENDIYTLEELSSIQGDYPLVEYMDNWGFEHCDRILASTEYVKMLDNICENNLEDIKDMLIVQYALFAGPYLDEEAQKTISDINEPRIGEELDTESRTEEEIKEDTIFGTYLGSSALEGAMDAEYVKYYVDDECYGRLYSMTEDIVEAIREMFLNESWLSEKGKAACLDKLDALKIHVISPEECDYKDLNIVTAKDGGNLLEAKFEIDRFGKEKEGEITATKVDRTIWDPYDYEMSTTVTNAYYSPETNGIYILAGIIDDPVYYQGMTDEELLGGIGMIVGHEITHGFDSGGVHYDKDGIENDWLPDEDIEAFTDKSTKVALFYNSLVPFESAGACKGLNLRGEAIADMGGISACINVGAKKDNFDYESFFTRIAEVWATQNSMDFEKYLMEYDVHPLAFHRVNVALSQFDKFHETFDIKEGDGMYVSPEDRIAIW